MFDIVIVLVLLLILYCLGSGLFFLLRQGQDSRGMVKALTWRIVLSLLLFGFLFLSYYLGWAHPHGLIIPVRQ